MAVLLTTASASAVTTTTFDWGTIVAGLVGGLAVAIVSTWTVRWSERRADLRRLRDRRYDRLRVAFEKMLLAAEVTEKRHR